MKRKIQIQKDTGSSTNHSNQRQIVPKFRKADQLAYITLCFEWETGSIRPHITLLSSTQNILP